MISVSAILMSLHAKGALQEIFVKTILNAQGETKNPEQVAPGVGEVEELPGVLVEGRLLLLVVLLVVGVDEHSLRDGGGVGKVKEMRGRWRR